MSKMLLAIAMVFALLGLPLFIGWLHGAFVIFWTVPGAALFQTLGCSAVCLWGAWLWRERT